MNTCNYQKSSSVKLPGINNTQGLLNTTDQQQTVHTKTALYVELYRGADKSLARPGRKQATATKDFEFRISYL
jgi:hypothetical protein